MNKFIKGIPGKFPKKIPLSTNIFCLTKFIKLNMFELIVWITFTKYNFIDNLLYDKYIYFTELSNFNIFL